MSTWVNDVINSKAVKILAFTIVGVLIIGLFIGIFSGRPFKMFSLEFSGTKDTVIKTVYISDTIRRQDETPKNVNVPVYNEESKTIKRHIKQLKLKEKALQDTVVNSKVDVASNSGNSKVNQNIGTNNGSVSDAKNVNNGNNTGQIGDNYLNAETEISLNSLNSLLKAIKAGVSANNITSKKITVLRSIYSNEVTIQNQIVEFLKENGYEVDANLSTDKYVNMKVSLNEYKNGFYVLIGTLQK